MKQNYILKMSLLAAYCVATSFVWGEPVDKNTAQVIASKYLANPELRATTPPTRATGASKQPAYYLFTNANEKRFVIISGESQLNELVGYGTMSAANAKNSIPEEF